MPFQKFTSVGLWKLKMDWLIKGDTFPGVIISHLCEKAHNEGPY